MTPLALHFKSLASQRKNHYVIKHLGTWLGNLPALRLATCWLYHLAGGMHWLARSLGSFS